MPDKSKRRTLMEELISPSPAPPKREVDFGSNAAMLNRRSAIQCHQPRQQTPMLDSLLLGGQFGTARPRPKRVLPELSEPTGSLKRMDQISKMKDPVARNLEITQMYHQVSNNMDRTLFPNPAEQQKTANWTTFATWASNEAGSAIRGEGNWVMDVGNAAARSGVGKWAGVDDRVDSTQKALADGNREVFAEIAPAFEMFSHNFQGDKKRDSDKFASFAKWMREEAPNRDERLGNEQLISAFRGYHDAMFETKQDRKQELILQANAKIGLHEQTRLQPYIEKAMPFGARTFLTQNSMFLHTPNNASGPAGLDFNKNYDRLDLGENLPVPRGRTEDHPYSRALTNLDDPSVARTMDQVDGSWYESDAAANWVDFDDRMDYIAELFRRNQNDPRLHNPPFTDAQKSKKLRQMGR